MNNIADTKEYKDIRKSVEKQFAEYEPIEDKTKEHLSPSGNYKLVITPYESGEGYWNYNMGVVLDTKTEEEVFVILRNYSSFDYCWVEHENGNEYLFCGEDYQGYVCLNLTKKKKHVYFPESGLKGWGFCWAEIKEYDKDFDDNELRVEGCHWGAQFENVVYDISNPDEVPYKELSREDINGEDDFEDEDE